MSFQRSLSMGKLGETLFYQAHQGTLTETDGRRGDFLHRDGYTVELKTDFYSMKKTENFFFERWSDMAAGSPGGVWQATEHGASKYVYFFVQDLTYFEFDTAALLARIEELAAKDALQKRTVRNASWSTEGYLVPRDLVADLAKPVTLTVSIRYD